MAKFYAWSDIHNGGEVKEIKGRNIVVNRNMVSRGEEVTKAKMKVSDEDWDALIDGGSVRSYPVPKDIPENESPASFVVRKMLAGKQEVDSNLLLELSLSNAQAGAFAEELEEEASELDEA